VRRLILSLSTAGRRALARRSRGTGIACPSCSLRKMSLYLKSRSRLADFACFPNSPSLFLRRCSLRTRNRLCPLPNLRANSPDRKTLSWVMERQRKQSRRNTFHRRFLSHSRCFFLPQDGSRRHFQ
jgi:hypothetical protein